MLFRSGEGSAKLNEAQSELTKNAAEVDVQLQNLESKQAELDTQKQLLEKTEALLNQTIEQLTEWSVTVRRCDFKD